MRTGERDVRDRVAIARRSLWLPGIVALYALLGAMWHPLLIGPAFDSFDCDAKPWLFVSVISLFLGVVFFVVGATLAIALQPAAAGLWMVVAGLLLALEALLLGVIVAANDYLLCSS